MLSTALLLGKAIGSFVADDAEVFDGDKPRTAASVPRICNERIISDIFEISKCLANVMSCSSIRTFHN